jgi:CubicO group peptidase (beta-lactamase class C family)
MLFSQTSPATLAGSVDQLYASFGQAGHPGCAIAVVKNDSVVYQHCFGLANIEQNIPITDSTLFGLASVTKQFTAYGVAKLLAEGRLKLSDTLGKLLPNRNKLWDSVQLGHLIHHSSGIWDWPYLLLACGHTFNDVVTHQMIMKLLESQATFNFQPGSDFDYASSNYILLGEIISQITDSSYFDWMQHNVMKPAKMSNAVFHRDNSALIENRANGYLEDGDSWQRTTDNISPQGTGSAYASLIDMIAWMKFWFSAYTHQNPLVMGMLDTDTLNNGKAIPYAFGLMKRNEDCFWHDGVFQGFRHITIYYPRQNMGVVLLSNSGSNHIMRSAFMVGKMFLKDSIPVEEIAQYQKLFSQVNLKEAELQTNFSIPHPEDYEGLFFNKSLLISYQIHKKNNLLFIENSLQSFLLQPVEQMPDCFITEEKLLGQFVFTRDQDGQVTGLKLLQKRGNKLIFNKINQN